MRLPVTILGLFCVTFFVALKARAASPEAYSQMATKMTCDAWAPKGPGQPFALIGSVMISAEMGQEPLISAMSEVPDLNFSFGRRLSAGKDYRTNQTYQCEYFYDDSTELSIRYFCNNYGEMSWMSNEYSSLRFSPMTATFTNICKRSRYGGTPGIRCWDLRNCK